MCSYVQTDQSGVSPNSTCFFIEYAWNIDHMSVPVIMQQKIKYLSYWYSTQFSYTLWERIRIEMDVPLRDSIFTQPENWTVEMSRQARKAMEGVDMSRWIVRRNQIMRGPIVKLQRTHISTVGCGYVNFQPMETHRSNKELLIQHIHEVYIYC
jgi:hypothetical protein